MAARLPDFDRMGTPTGLVSEVSPHAGQASLAELYETGLVDIFADLAELFGNPRSYGQIYGLLFARETPLTMEEIARRLEISQGSISQGLRQLEAFGAVIKQKHDGSRQALYSAKLEMKLLISGFLKERVIPRLESTESRVEEIRRVLATDKHILDKSFLETANHRLGRVAKWHRSARTILPLARKILGGG